MRLVERINDTLIISKLDILDGSPLLDIKPFIPAFEYTENIRLGWIGEKLKKRDAEDFRA